MRYRWFVLGDLNACFALVLDNMVNLVVLAGILVGFGFPKEVIFYKMIPGTALGVLVGDLVYTVLALRLARKSGRQDVTAMPLGLDTPSTFGMALAVIGPAFVASKSDLLAQGLLEGDAVQKAAMIAWGIGMAVMVVMGLVKVAFSFIGDWVRRHVPTAGLLGSIGGIGLALLACFPLIDIFKVPVVGLVVLGIVLYALVAKIRLPWGLPGAAVAVGVGAALYYGLGAFHLLPPGVFKWPEPALTPALPWPSSLGLSSLGAALPYLPIAIPFGLLTIVGGINVTESARAAGDDYRTRDILLTEAVATLVAGFCGGVAQSTPYIGHPAYKQMGARAGYTLATGLAVGLGGMVGCVSFIVAALPSAAVVPLLLFVGLEIVAQAFHASPQRHAPAVAFAFLPIVADLLLIRQDGFVGSLRYELGRLSAQLGDGAKAVHAAVDGVLVTTDGPIIAGLGHGFILTAMLWGSFFALIIDRRLRQAGLFIVLCGVLAAFGIIHSADPTGAMYWPWQAPSPMVWQWVAGYLAFATLMVALSWSKGARAAGGETQEGATPTAKAA